MISKYTASILYHIVLKYTHSSNHMQISYIVILHMYIIILHFALYSVYRMPGRCPVFLQRPEPLPEIQPHITGPKSSCQLLRLVLPLSGRRDPPCLGGPLPVSLGELTGQLFIPSAQSPLPSSLNADSADLFSVQYHRRRWPSCFNSHSAEEQPTAAALTPSGGLQEEERMGDPKGV